MTKLGFETQYKGMDTEIVGERVQAAELAVVCCSSKPQRKNAC